MIRRAVTTLAAAVVLAACGGGSTKPADTPANTAGSATASSAYAELEARIPKMLAAMDQLAKDLTAVSGDCPEIAAVLRKWGSQYAFELDALWELKNKLTPAEKERYEHDHDEDAKRLRPIFDASMKSCQGNEEVEDALTVAGFRRAESAR